MNISKNLRKKLPKEIFSLLKFIGREADKHGYKAYCVGGFVRDIFLGLRNLDIDIAVEENAINFSQMLAKKLHGTLVVHKKFGTATIYFKDNLKIDIATARTEKYHHPAVLPTVKFGSIKQDLYRRDFTINAMAVSINRKTFGALADFFKGIEDINRKKIRVLHELSFVDDPTRIFRAVRFEQRFDFKIEPYTQKLIKTAVSLDMFEKTQKQRIRQEVVLMLNEPEPIKALRRMNELHELRFIHPKLKLNKQTLSLFKTIEKILILHKNFINKEMIDKWIIYFMALIKQFTFDQTNAACERFVFSKKNKAKLISAKRNAEKTAVFLDRRGDILPSETYKLLKPLSCELVFFIMALTKTKSAKKRISSFLKRDKNIKLKITGTDLKKLGLAPGPEYKKILDKLLYAKIDGEIKTKKAELVLAKRYTLSAKR